MRSKDQILLENIYNNLLLEKDHRQKMLSFGMPQDVADYLHNFNDKYSLWFADKIKNMKAFQTSMNKINWIRTNLETNMTGIMDWVRNVPNINLKQFNWDQAVEAQTKYHENLQTNTLEGNEKNTIIKQYKDGFYWVDLESTNDCEESDAMGHCGRTGKADTLYSLRKYFKETQTIEPFITMAISPDEGIWYQCKGKRNSKPKQEYYQYIADILITKNCFIFKTEYDSTHDFTNKDFEQYVEQHSNEIPNSDDILEKISGNNVSYAQFEKIFKEYNFPIYSIYLNDYDEGVYINEDFGLNLDYNEFPDIPNIKSIIEENQGDYSNAKHLSDMFNRFDVYPNSIQISTSENSESFFISCDSDSSDSQFGFNDEGLDAFKRKCESVFDSNENFDREDFIKKFKIAIIKEGWVSDEYASFFSEIKEEYGDKLTINYNRDNDASVTFPSFENPLLKFKKILNHSYFALGYTKHRDLTDEEKLEYPYIQYTIDFFKYFIFNYLEVPDVFSITGDRNSDKIYATLNLEYDEKNSYDYKKIKSSLDLLVSKYNQMIDKFKNFCDSILIPNVESAKKLKFNDVFFKEEDILNILNRFKREERSHASLYLYSKDDGKKLTSVSIWGFDITRNLDDDDIDKFQKIIKSNKNDEITNDEFSSIKSIIIPEIKYIINDDLERSSNFIFSPYDKNLVRKFLYDNIGGQMEMNFEQYILEKYKRMSAGMNEEDIAKKDKVPVSTIKKQIKMGKKVETEHGVNIKKAKRIAMDHLAENPKYYTKLKKAKL